MEYVMVPVPEEHVVDVMQYVAKLVARASVVPWTDEAVGQVFDEVDEASRSVLSLVARTLSAQKELSDEEAADRLELNVREVRGVLRDINEIALRDGHEPMITLREKPVVLRNGRTVQKRMFAMAETVARAIRSHERATLEGGPGTPESTSE